MHDDFYGSFKDDMLRRAPGVFAETKARKEVKLHDFRVHKWGWYCGRLELKEKKRWFRKPLPYVWMDCALGLGVKDGDELILPLTEGKAGVYIAKRVRYANDPRDMFSAELYYDRDYQGI